MKIAWFSPLPPKRTGIATYSTYLVPAVRARAEIDIYDAGEVGAPAPNCRRFDYVADPGCLITLDSYDACVYHIGNQPDYHLEMFRVLLRQPGIVVLHDAVLYFLAAGGGSGALLKELCFERGGWAWREWQQIIAQSPHGDILHYPQPERFPLLKRLLSKASAVIVHSETSKRLVAEAGCRVPIHVVHMPAPDPAIIAELGNGDAAAARTELGIPENCLLIGVFGFIGKTKRPAPLLKALNIVQLIVPFRLLIAGIGDDLGAEISRSRHAKLIIRRGFAPDAVFLRLMASADIIVNLRYPSMGEASLTLIQAMACGRPCIVTDHAWFSELPDSCVWKIPYGNAEVEALARAITTLGADGNLRKRLGDAAMSYVLTHCLPNQVADEYMRILGEHSSSGMEAIGKRVESVEEEPTSEEEPTRRAWKSDFLQPAYTSHVSPRGREDKESSQSPRGVESDHSGARSDTVSQYPMGEPDGADNDTTPEWVRVYFARRIKRAIP